MRESPLRGALTVVLVSTGLVLSPAIVAAQEGHEQEAATGHEEAGGHETNEKNEIAAFIGGTRRLKFEEDETGLTFGLEYMHQFFPRAATSIAVEWANGSIERDWVVMLKLGVQPFDNWAHPFYLYVGTGIEVAEIDEGLLEEDEHDENEVDALMRLGVGWAIHAGSFSIIPNINTDIVGEDWALVGGVTVGYRF